jgi:hypothetical protein
MCEDTDKEIIARGAPAKCPLSHNPYTYCPLVFKHEDDMILSYIESLVDDVHRLNGLPMGKYSSEEPQSIDRWACTITAYMNGRIHELVKDIRRHSAQEKRSSQL